MKVLLFFLLCLIGQNTYGCGCSKPKEISDVEEMAAIILSVQSSKLIL